MIELVEQLELVGPVLVDRQLEDHSAVVRGPSQERSVRGDRDRRAVRSQSRGIRRNYDLEREARRLVRAVDYQG